MSDDPPRDKSNEPEVNVNVNLNEEAVHERRVNDPVSPAVEPASMLTIRFLTTIVIVLIVLLIIVLLATGVIPSS